MKTMLVVDDSAFMRSLVKKSIVDLDISVIGEAGDGKEAYEKYVELNPDIVTLDLAMIEHNGIDALKNIMLHDPKAKVIVISSTTNQPNVVEEVMALGARTVINKPNIKDALINAVKEIDNE